jgi:hypothetical protein
MSLKVIPFSFFGSSESDLPIVAALNLSNPTTTSIDVQFSIFDDGTGAPITDFGIVYSSTDQDPVIGAPGVNQQSLGGTPPSIPGSYNGTVSGLSDTTEYYFKAYAINSEGTAYTPVKSLETQWDAFTYAFDKNRISPYVYQNDVLIGYISVGSVMFRGTNYSFGDQKIKIKVSQPGNSNVQDQVINYEYTGSNSGQAVFIPKNSNWNNTPIYISIAPQDPQNPEFNNFRFSQSPSQPNQWNSGNTIIAAGARVAHWGPTQWMSLYGMFGGDSNQPASYSSVIAADDLPDLSQCETMAEAFRLNQAAYTNIYQPTDPVYLGPQQDVGDWDVSNIEDAGYAFYGSRAGFGYDIVWPDLSWDNCTSLEYFWGDSNAGYGTPSSNKLDMRNWTFNTDPNSEIDFNRFFINVATNNFIDGSAIYWFDLNNIQTNKLRFDGFFSNNSHLRFGGSGTNTIGNWGPKINQLEPHSYFTNRVDLSFLFYFCGVNTSGIKIDFTSWDFETVTGTNYMFGYTRFDPSAINYSTMMTNKTWGTNIVADNVSWATMFISAYNIPPLDNWTFNYISSFQNMFAYFRATTGGASVPDLSTWKTSIDALQPFKPSSTVQIKYLDISYMFYFASSNPLPAGFETWSWPTNSNVDYINNRSMLAFARVFNRDVNTWNVSKFNDFTEMFYQNWEFNNGEAAGLSGNPLTFTGGFMTTANTVAPPGKLTAMLNDARSFNQSVNSWGDLRKFDADFTLGGIFNTTTNLQGTTQQPAVFTHDIGGWIPPCPQPGGVMGSNIAAYWTTQQIDDTLIGWAKEMLAVNFQPTGGQTGWVETNPGYNSPSCLPAAVNPGGPYTVPADITNVQDALDFFTTQLGWSIGLPPCT